MTVFLVRRFLAMILSAFLVLTVSFFLIHLIPGDPAAVLLGPGATPDRIQALRQSLGLDQPVGWQYVKYVNRVLRGDLGLSIYFQQPVLSVVLAHAEASLLLGLLGILVVIGLGISAGVISAVRPYTWWDRGFLFVALLGASIPSFWLGLMLMLLFAFYLKWLPTSGFASVFKTGSLLNLRYLVLPALTLGFVNSALVARVTRSAMLDVLRQPYIDAAWAKGLSGSVVVLKHALRNAAIPIVTVLGFIFAGMVATAVVTENVFAIPGIGRLTVQSVLRRDYPMIQGIMLLVAFLYLLINFLIDLIYAVLDPRIRLS